LKSTIVVRIQSADHREHNVQSLAGTIGKCWTVTLLQLILTHCGRVTQICVFTLQLCRTG